MIWLGVLIVNEFCKHIMPFSTLHQQKLNGSMCLQKWQYYASICKNGSIDTSYINKNSADLVRLPDKAMLFVQKLQIR